MEMGICVLIGGDDLLEERLEEEAPEAGMLRLLVEDTMLNHTYKEFLDECLLYVNAAVDDPAIKAVYTKVKSAAQGNTRHDKYSVGLLNRQSGETENFDLEENVQDTCSRFIYSTAHMIDGDNTTLKTLEMYIMRQECGGYDAFVSE